MSKARLLPKDQWVDDCVDTSIDESLEDFKGDTQRGYGTVTLWVPPVAIFWLRDCNYECSSPDLWNFELAQAETKEVTKPRFES